MLPLRLVLLCLLAVPGWASEDVPTILRQLNGLQQSHDPSGLEVAWVHLDADNGTIREAARKIIQGQAFETWRARALEEKRTWASLEILRALVESCPRDQAAELSPHLCEQITTLRIEQMDDAQWRAAQRLTRLVFEGLGPLTEDERRQMIDLWSGLARPAAAAVEKERGELLEFLRTVGVRPG